MDTLAIHLALHGAAVMLVSLCAGLFTYRAILHEQPAAAWHLAHAGGTARGVMLIALAAIVRLPALPLWEISLVAWLLIFFTWTSVFAMLIAAASGQRGLGFNGSHTNGRRRYGGQPSPAFVSEGRRTSRWRRSSCWRTAPLKGFPSSSGQDTQQCCRRSGPRADGIPLRTRRRDHQLRKHESASLLAPPTETAVPHYRIQTQR